MQMRVKMQQPAYKYEKMQMRALFVNGPIPELYSLSESSWFVWVFLWVLCCVVWRQVITLKKCLSSLSKKQLGRLPMNCSKIGLSCEAFTFIFGKNLFILLLSASANKTFSCRSLLKISNHEKIWKKIHDFTNKFLYKKNVYGKDIYWKKWIVRVTRITYTPVIALFQRSTGKICDCWEKTNEGILVKLVYINAS